MDAEPKAGKGTLRTKNNFIGCLRRIEAKGESIVQLLKCSPYSTIRGTDQPRVMALSYAMLSLARQNVAFRHLEGIDFWQNVKQQR
jgi:hypothetical protein